MTQSGYVSASLVNRQHHASTVQRGGAGRSARYFGGLTVAGLAMMAAVTPVHAGTWTVQKENLATILIGLDVVDGNVIYAAGGQDGTGPAIFKTNDGGQIWVQQIDNMQSASYLAIDAYDADHAIAGGLGMFYRFAGASYTDNGRDWHPGRDRWLASAYQDVEAVSAEDMFLIGAWSTARNYVEGVAASYDGGHTFTYFDWGIDTGARYGSFIDNAEGFIAGGEWPDDSSARYGRGSFRLNRWMNLPTDHGTAAHRTSTTGYRGTIAHTVNGGQSWEIVYDDYDRFYFNQVEFTDALNGWAVAEGDSAAYILHTADGGYTWEEQHVQDAGSLLALKMLSPTEGWAGGAIIGATGFKSLLLHTVDGGKTWQPYDQSLRYYIMNLDGLADGRVWAVAYGTSGAMSVLKYTP